VKVAIPLSGGIDSSAAIFYLVENGHQPYPYLIDYSQKASPEIDAAVKIARFAGARLIVEPLFGKLPNSPMVHENCPIPLVENAMDAQPLCKAPGVYPEVIAAGVRHSALHSCDLLCLPIAPGTSQFFPEATENSIIAANILAQESSNSSIKIFAPFLKTDKLTLLKMLIAAGAPYWETYSCISSPIHCGTCPKCAIRKSLFAATKEEDPTTYEI